MSLSGNRKGSALLWNRGQPWASREPGRFRADRPYGFVLRASRMRSHVAPPARGVAGCVHGGLDPESIHGARRASRGNPIVGDENFPDAPHRGLGAIDVCTQQMSD